MPGDADDPDLSHLDIGDDSQNQAMLQAPIERSPSHSCSARWAAGTVLSTCAVFLLFAGFAPKRDALPEAREMANKCKTPPTAPYSGPAVYGSDSFCSKGLFPDNADGSIRSYNLVIKEDDLDFLNRDPRKEEYVPCDVVVNYQGASSATIEGAKCRYKGSSGSWSNCLTAGKYGAKAKSNEKCRKLSWKVNVKKGSNDAAKEGTDTFQFLGIQHEDTMMKQRLAYMILNEVGFTASCVTPAHIYVNGAYDGVYDYVENVGKAFIKSRFKTDTLGGKGALWKEVWPTSSNPNYYLNVPGKPFVSESPECKENCDPEDGDDPGRDIFAVLHAHAKVCLQMKGGCSKEKAAEILDT
eukprot:TRINITY_DN26060_c0_g1_i1.p1 TRINITY_DN26060_c0_g1~~TRINITY_DN26060_c0_g1_i1.p1  ORF type:complete len:365 (+),score=70.00 TRINITY_DN26060_c0_g1_i1:35-1096(+)